MPKCEKKKTGSRKRIPSDEDRKTLVLEVTPAGFHEQLLEVGLGLCGLVAGTA